jgi:AraC-like DNA-binding protein
VNQQETRRVAPGVYRIMAVVDGMLLVQFDDKREDFGPGEAALLLPEQSATLHLTQGSRCLQVAFTVVHTPLTGKIGSLRLLPNAPRQPSPLTVWGLELPCRLSPRLAQQSLTTIELIRGEYWLHLHGYVRACARLAMLLAGILAEAAAAQTQGQDASAGTEVERLVRRHLAQVGHPVPRIRELARQMNMSREHLSRMFRAATGCTLAAWLAERRWCQATTLLADENTPISAVAFFSGYTSATGFSAAFRERYGCSPGTWRRRMRGG